MENDMIKVTYRSVDRVRETRSFKTLKGAQKFAHDMVGEHPEQGLGYAVSGDGIGRVSVSGCAIPELFPSKLSNDVFNKDAQEYRKATTERRIELEDKWGDRAGGFQADPLEAAFADFIRQETNLPKDM